MTQTPTAAEATGFEAVPGIAGLSASAPQTLPFAPSLEIRAFRLHRDAGDVLVYSTTTLGAVDGVERWYLNHRHEATFAPDGLAVALFTHEDERGSLHVRGTFTRRHTIDGDFEAIPTPGHTSGATAYLWDSGEHRLLFTGDTVFLSGGEWVAAVLDSSDRRAYAESLELIRELDFDVLVPWAATAGEPYHALTDRADTRRRIDAMLARSLRGARRS